MDLIDGDRGEFSVTVDGQEVIRKTGDTFPKEDEILSAVHRAMPAHT